MDGVNIEGSSFIASGLVIPGCEAGTIAGNEFSQGAAMSIRRVDSFGLYVTNNRLTDAGSISITSGADVHVTGNILERSGGISVTLSGALATGSRIDANQLTECGAGITYSGEESGYGSVSNNTLWRCGGGIAMVRGGDDSVAGNTVVECPAAGISTVAGGAHGPTLARNLVVGNAQGISVAASTLASHLSCNDVWSNPGGDWVGIADPTGTNGNLSLDPLFCFRPRGDLTLWASSPCLAAPGCGLIGSRPMGCEGTLYRVEADGSGDLPTIQAAIDAASDGTTIELGDGTYTGPGNRDIDFAGKAVVVRSRSGSPAACIIDAQGSATESHRGFRFFHQEGPDAVVENITVRHGHASGSSLDEHGGAVLCIGGSSPTLRGCVFSANVAANSGGGVMARRSLPVIQNCVFTGNQALYGAGAYFYDCDSAGVDPSAVYLDHCVLAGNQATWLGGGVVLDRISASKITGSTFAGNSALFGGGVHLRDSSSDITTTLIAFSAMGRGVSCDSSVAASQARLGCCDLFGNHGGDWVGCIAGQAGTNGNLAADPRFCGAAIDDFHLDAASPCLAAPGCGLIGALPRGCDGVPTGVEPGEPRPPRDLLLGPVSPNPFNSLTEITCAIPSGSGPGPVRLAVYSPSGRVVRILVDEPRGPGCFRAVWNGCNQEGRPVASGIYYARLSRGDRVRTLPITLVR